MDKQELLIQIRLLYKEIRGRRKIIEELVAMLNDIEDKEM
jgi:hypothetical protein